MEILDWFQANWQDIIFALSLIVSGVSLIVRATPTLADDSVWLPVVKFLSKYLAINDTRDHSQERKEL